MNIERKTQKVRGVLKVSRMYFSKISRKIAVTIFVFVFSMSLVTGLIISVASGMRLEKNAYEQVTTIARQISNSIDGQLALAMKRFIALEIDEDFNNIAKRTENISFPEQFIKLKRSFNKHKSEDLGLIDNIFFYRYDDVIFTEYSYSIQVSKIEESFVEQVKKAPLSPVWMYPGVVYNTYGLDKSESYISIVKEINDGKYVYGILVVNLKKEILKDICSDVNINKNHYKILMLDKNNHTFLSAGDYEETKIDWKNQNLYNNDEAFYQKALFINTKLSVGDLRLVSMFSQKLFAQQSALIGRYFLYCIIVGILIFFGITYFVSIIVTKPLHAFAKVISSTAEGDFDKKFKYEKDDEIGFLANRYNYMVERVRELMEQIKKTQDLKLVAELNLLYHQINAHFLYNTLDVIYWMSKNGDTENAAEITIALSEMMRISVSKGRNMIEVRNECTHLEKYLMIQSFRFDFDYDIDVAPEISEYKVPKLILQPLVENAIIHGFENIDYRGKIDVKGKIENGKLVFKIADNGCGFVPDEILNDVQNGDIKASTKYALRNMHTRFNLQYGEGEYMKIVTQPGKGTCVILTLPVT